MADTDEPRRGGFMGDGAEEPATVTANDLTYGQYLQVPELLALQTLQSDPPHHDEMLFIIIHQAYELWFKLILHELEQAIGHMRAAEVLKARHFVARVVEIEKLLVRQIHILETLEPVEFLQFRSRLMPASGFQSMQFREIEFLVGLKEPRYLGAFKYLPEGRARLERRLAEPSLRDAYYEMLRGLGFAIPEQIDYAHLEAHADDRKRLIEAVRPIWQHHADHLPLHLLSESLLDLDQYLSLWRDHHVRVVERVIGFKRGTGGSSGVSYLRSTVGKQIFPCLWEVRTHLEARHEP